MKNDLKAILSGFYDECQQRKLPKSTLLLKFTNIINIALVEGDISLLEHYLLQDMKLSDYCNKFYLDYNKTYNRLRRIMFVIRSTEKVGHLLGNTKIGTINIRKDRMYWLEAINTIKNG